MGSIISSYVFIGDENAFTFPLNLLRIRLFSPFLNLLATNLSSTFAVLQLSFPKVMHHCQPLHLQSCEYLQLHFRLIVIVKSSYMSWLSLLQTHSKTLWFDLTQESESIPTATEFSLLDHLCLFQFFNWSKPFTNQFQTHHLKAEDH